MSVQDVCKRSNQKDRDRKSISADAHITLGDLGQKHHYEQRHDKDAEKCKVIRKVHELRQILDLPGRKFKSHIVTLCGRRLHESEIRRSEIGDIRLFHDFSGPV